jgi:parallel beta-helix repeat protein
MRSSTARWLLAGIVLLFLTIPAWAATITVTNLNDSGAGSLRQAIIDASSGDTINFFVTGTITLISGELVINKTLTISGPGASQLTISGNNASRVFKISSVTATISGLTITNGATTGSGGGIRNNGNTTLTNCTVSGNTSDSKGGGIWNSGYLILTNCTVSGNTTDYGGGGIYNAADGNVTLTDCTVSGNTTIQSGGGICNNGDMTLTNCTVSGNTTVWFGGGIRNDGDMTLTNCTVSGNTAEGTSFGFGGGIYNFVLGTLTLTNCTVSGNTTDRGGGIYNATGDTDFKNTIIANNTATPYPDCFGPFDSYGYNLIESTGGGCTITEVDNPGTNITGQDPNLGPLQDNGGPTETHALLPGSPAIDAGSCTDIGGSPVSGDQRGVGRPQGIASDIGAYEYKYPVGDVDADGKIDVLDVRLCLQIATGFIAGTAEQREQADMDEDGDVDMDDVHILSEYIIGM